MIVTSAAVARETTPAVSGGSGATDQPWTDQSGSLDSVVAVRPLGLLTHACSPSRSKPRSYIKISRQTAVTVFKRHFLSNWRNSMGAPFSTIKATVTPGEGELGAMSISFPAISAERSSTLGRERPERSLYSPLRLNSPKIGTHQHYGKERLKASRSSERRATPALAGQLVEGYIGTPWPALGTISVNFRAKISIGACAFLHSLL